MSPETKIVVSCESVGEMEAKIIDKNPKTAESVLGALPFKGIVNVWGEEIYFEIPVEMVEEKSQQEMEVGDIAFWPVGNAMCIFFGRTPVSESEQPKAYSPVNLFAKILGDAKVIKNVRDGEVIKVERTGL